MKATRCSSQGPPEISIDWHGPLHGVVRRGAERRPFTAARLGSAVWIRCGGRTHVIEAESSQGSLSAGQAPQASAPTSPMPGVILALPVQEGQRVARGDLLVSIEAMKMEHEIRAPAPALLARVHVKQGQRVEAGTPLCELRFETGGEP